MARTQMIRIVRFCLSVVALGAGAAGAFAQDPDAARVAVKKMARETLECAAYFDIVSLVLLNANERTTSNQYVEARKLAAARADSLEPGILNTQYNDIVKEMADKVAMANIPKAIDKTLANVSIAEITVLQNQYGRLCKEVVNTPGERSKYWMGQVGATPSP
jgi:preprotein translocase subunit SecG